MNLILRIISNIVFTPFWHFSRIFPRKDNLWVFGAWFGQKYSDNAKELFEYINVNDNSVKAVWITKNKFVYKKLKEQNIKCYMKNSFHGIITCLRAKVFIFSSSVLDINPLLMNGAIKIQTWHGAPMKKIGRDNNFSKHNSRDKLIKLFFPYLSEYCYDYVVSSSSFFDDFLCSAFNVNKKQIINTGYPRNDVFFKNKKSKYLEFLLTKFNSPRIIFYLPTFRDNDPSIDLFFQFGFDLNLWDKYLKETNSLLVLKPHFASASFSENLKSERIIFIKDEQESDVNLFLKDVDLLITDYSGAYFDFKLTSKPLILAPFDLEEYISLSRELYIDYKDLNEYKEYSWNGILNGLIQNKFVEKFDNEMRFNDHFDGNSSKRLLKFIKKIF